MVQQIQNGRCARHEGIQRSSYVPCPTAVNKFYYYALRNVMTKGTAWDIHCNIKWFYYAIWPIVILYRYSCTAP